MNYRMLGRTGLKVSEIALGCEGFLSRDDAFAREMFRLALAGGINCMDLYSPNPDLQRRVGQALLGAGGSLSFSATCAPSGTRASTGPPGSRRRWPPPLRPCWPTWTPTMWTSA